jgi:ATP-dependent Lhr-like helicase
MQLVIHSPYGSRINRAWGLALRKRFCVKFNFELQAAATEDAIVLSLSTSHSFDLEVGRALPALEFGARRRDAGHARRADVRRALALGRRHRARAAAISRRQETPAPLQRMRAEDLMAHVFPDQIACAENLAGDREIPDHPLVRQTVHDCLHDAMDIDGLEHLLRRIESGDIAVIAA